MLTVIEQVPQLILAAVETTPLLGYGAIALVMLLENVVPPIPSEVVMPQAGSLIQQGKLELVPTVLAGLLGTVLGAWFWYGVGRMVNERRPCGAGCLQGWRPWASGPNSGPRSSRAECRRRSSFISLRASWRLCFFLGLVVPASPG